MTLGITHPGFLGAVVVFHELLLHAVLISGKCAWDLQHSIVRRFALLGGSRVTEIFVNTTGRPDIQNKVYIVQASC